MPENKTSPLITGGELILYGYVGGDPEDSWFPGFSGQHVVKALDELEGDITVRVNSGGGSAWDGIAIYNALKAHDGRVTIRVDAIAASAASVIAMAADELIVPPASTMMIHDASLITIGNADDHRASAHMLEKLDGQMAELYAKRTGLPVDDIAALMDAETWLTGTEAVEKGFADTTGEADDDVEEGEAAAAAFPYEIYARTPDRLAAVASTVPAEVREHLPRLNLRRPRVALPAMPTAERRPTPAASAAPTPEATMPDKTKTPAPETKAGDDKAIETAVKAERERASGIRAAVKKAKLPVDLADDLIEAGVDLPTARERIIDALADADDAIETRGHTRVEVGLEARDKFRAGVEASILAKVGHADGARNEFSSLSLMEIARASLEHRGIRLPSNADRMMIAGAALNPMAFGYHSSDDFTEILGNVANKAMLKGWEETPESFDRWTSRGNASDFKTISRVDLNAFPSLDVVPEGAEYNFATIGERKATITVATYGKKFAITRQAIINDDLGLFNRLPNKMGRAARRTVGNLVWAVLTGNPDMPDAVALFHADHDNLASSGAAPSVATLSAGKTAMAVHKDPDDNATALNIRPSYMLVPVALEDTAKVLMASEQDPAKTSRTANPHRGTLEVISDARLDAASSTAWYLAASPMLADTIEVTYLDGNDAPVLERRAGWDVDGVEMKVRIDAGVTPLDFRGLYKDPGQ